MTPAELKSWREALGLQAEWCREKLGISLRAFRYLEAGVYTKGLDDFQALLRRVQAQQEAMVARALEVIRKSRAKQVTLTRYRQDQEMLDQELPATAHARAMWEIRRVAAEEKIGVRIVHFDRDAYAAWLSSRADTHAHRAQWAAESLAGTAE